MFDLPLWLGGLAALAVFAAAGWLLSLPLRNVSIVDSLWSLMFLLAAVVYLAGQASVGPRAWLVITLVALWSIRLAAYITWRNHGQGEDFRYRKMRADNDPGFAFKSLYIVFGLQAALAWVISLPLLAAMGSSAPLGALDAAGAALWLVGMVFEAGGDWQLSRFKSDPASRGKVLDTGLWRYTRHPNYFGDFCVWWGLFLIALSAGGWWSIVGPLLMSFMLLKVSGVALLEKDIGERRPDYQAYISRTNAFFPGPPRAS
jgi:steroid 5-alpha reductase family enzyme